MDLQDHTEALPHLEAPQLEPLGPLGTDNDLLLFILFVLFLFFLFYCNSLQTSQKTFKWKAASFILPLSAVPAFVSVYSGPGLVSDIIFYAVVVVSYLPGGSNGKEFACSAGDPGSIPGPGRSPGEGIGNLLQHPCLETFMAGYSSWDYKELDSSDWLSLFTFSPVHRVCCRPMSFEMLWLGSNFVW